MFVYFHMKPHPESQIIVFLVCISEVVNTAVYKHLSETDRITFSFLVKVKT